MKQPDRHKHGKVIRISGNILRELNTRRGELSYNQVIDKLLMKRDGKLRRFRGWLRGLLKKVLYTDISIGG